VSSGRPTRVEILERRAIYRGFFGLDLLRLRHDRFDGTISRELRRELFVQGRAVAVLPFDPVADTVTLIEQFRTGLIDETAGAWSLEGIAGILEAGELLEAAAVREAKEEAGLDLGRLVAAGSYHSSPGATSEQVTCFVGEVRTPPPAGRFGRDDEDEDIKVTTVPFAEAVAAQEAGRITAANTVVPLLWLRLHHDRLAAEWAGP
jgi:ADP-ribose pyrophosphatase